jgi:hypothetical protein
VGERHRELGDRRAAHLAQWQDYVDALGTVWTAEDEALVDSLVPPGHPSTPGYTDPAYPVLGRITDASSLRHRPDAR